MPDPTHTAFALSAELFSEMPEVRPRRTFRGDACTLTPEPRGWECVNDEEGVPFAVLPSDVTLAYCRSHCMVMLAEGEMFVAPSDNGTWRLHTRYAMHVGFSTIDHAICAGVRGMKKA